MRFLVGGSSGFIGKALCQYLITNGHDVSRLVRGASGVGDISWSPEDGVLSDIEGFDVVVHLGGSRVDVRWTASQKQRIRESRVASTSLLAHAIRKLNKKPSAFICASAIGIYGNRDDEALTEDSSLGTGFLAETCKEWERAADPGIRTVNLRTGQVLGRGGMLRRLLPLFRLGVGGPLGSGKQYTSWIAIDDVVRAIEFVAMKESASGPVNITAPSPVTNEAFSRTLAKILHRPCFLRVPTLMLKLLYGQMAEEALLGGQRVLPKRLLDNGFEFKYGSLEEALIHVV